jgi:membrane protease YdiL (CAAX protease family)
MKPDGWIPNGCEGDSPERNHRSGPPRKVQVLEVLVFLFLILPSLALSFTVSSETDLTFASLAVATLLRDLALVSLVLFFLWRNGEERAKIGWTFDHLGREAAVGVGLFIPFSFAAGFLEKILSQSGLSAPSRAALPSLLPSSSGELVLAFLLVVVVAVAEETIFRGYLILRFHAATKNMGAAVLLSVLVFSLGHGYEGTAGLLTVAMMGLVLALVYLWRRSLVAPMVMHFLQDFMVIIAAPFFTSLH